MMLSAGDCLGRYEVLGPIGAGGMGEVWRARDPKLGREVAIKVLPEDYATDENRLDRFHRETMALAALSHPNLLDIYDVGAADGIHYAVTELLEGDTLRERITSSGLPWKKVATIGAAAADGLAAAHGRGIIHRDLKPENLFITADGRVKILDFGLASMFEEASPDAETATITEAGTIMGTPGYMAPEQVKGRQTDPRSDIFSLGCVLYEMASGRRAFRGDTGVEVIAAILKEEPPQLSSSGARVPVDLERAVHRCLEKHPEARFQSAADLAYNLKNIGGAPSTPVMATPGSGVEEGPGKLRRWGKTVLAVALVAIAAVTVWQALTSRNFDWVSSEAVSTLEPNRIAVVPFVNRSGDPTLDPLARRAAERVVGELADVEGLEVAPAGAVIGAATAAGLVLTGVVDAANDEIELRATLKDVISGRVVRTFDTLYTTRDEADAALGTLGGWVFVTIVETLHPSLRFAAGDRIPDPAAFREFLAGLPNLGINAESQLHLQTALDLDPRFDRLRIYWVFAAWGSHRWQFSDAFLQPVEARRAELNTSQQRLVDAARWGLEGRWGAALNVFREYTLQHPEDCVARAILMGVTNNANRPRQSLEAFRDIRWDPVQPTNGEIIVFLFAADAHHRLGQYEEELEVVRSLWEKHSGFFGTTWVRGPELRALSALGRVEECEGLVTEALAEPTFGPIRYGQMMLQTAEELRAHGHGEAAERMAERALEWFARTEFDPAWISRVRDSTAESLSFLGRHEEAYRLAMEAMAERPDRWECWSKVGIEAASLGNVETALRMGDRLATVAEPFTFGQPFVDRAAIAAQLGDTGEAVRLLQRALAAGYSDYHRLHVSADLDPLRDDPGFQELLRPKD